MGEPKLEAVEPPPGRGLTCVESSIGTSPGQGKAHELLGRAGARSVFERLATAAIACKTVEDRPFDKDSSREASVVAKAAIFTRAQNTAAVKAAEQIRKAAEAAAMNRLRPAQATSSAIISMREAVAAARLANAAEAAARAEAAVKLMERCQLAHEEALTSTESSLVSKLRVLVGEARRVKATDALQLAQAAYTVASRKAAAREKNARLITRWETENATEVGMREGHDGGEVVNDVEVLEAVPTVPAATPAASSTATPAAASAPTPAAASTAQATRAFAAVRSIKADNDAAARAAAARAAARVAANEATRTQARAAALSRANALRTAEPVTAEPPSPLAEPVTAEAKAAATEHVPSTANADARPNTSEPGTAVSKPPDALSSFGFRAAHAARASISAVSGSSSLRLLNASDARPGQPADDAAQSKHNATAIVLRRCALGGHSGLGALASLMQADLASLSQRLGVSSDFAVSLAKGGMPPVLPVPPEIMDKMRASLKLVLNALTHKLHLEASSHRARAQIASESH